MRIFPKGWGPGPKALVTLGLGVFVVRIAYGFGYAAGAGAAGALPPAPKRLPNGTPITDPSWDLAGKPE